MKTCKTCSSCIGETRLVCNDNKSDEYTNYVDSNMSCQHWGESQNKKFEDVNLDAKCRSCGNLYSAMECDLCEGYDMFKG